MIIFHWQNGRIKWSREYREINIESYCNDELLFCRCNKTWSYRIDYRIKNIIGNHKRYGYLGTYSKWSSDEEVELVVWTVKHTEAIERFKTYLINKILQVKVDIKNRSNRRKYNKENVFQIFSYLRRAMLPNIYFY